MGALPSKFFVFSHHCEEQLEVVGQKVEKAN